MAICYHDLVQLVFDDLEVGLFVFILLHVSQTSENVGICEDHLNFFLLEFVGD